MTDTQTKILEVIVDNNKAIASISEYNRLIDEQKQKQALLAVELKNGTISQTDYYKELAKSKEEVRAYSRSMQELSKEVQNNIKDAQEQDGSLRSLRAQLSNLTKEFDALSRAERNGDAGKAKMAEINRITTELKEAEAETQRFYRNVGNYPDIKPLETQLGEIRKQLAQLKFEGKENSEEFKELAEQAANMKDALMDVEQQINATASDTRNLDTAVVGLTTVMGGLSVMSSLFAEGSEEGKKFQQILQKTQLAMAALVAIQNIQKNTQKQSLIYLAAEKVQLVAINALKKVQTALTARQTAATGAQTVAQAALNAVMNANPVLLLVSAFAALATGVALAAKAISTSSDELKAQQAALKAAQDGLEAYRKTADITLETLNKMGAPESTQLWAKMKANAEISQKSVEIYRAAYEAEQGKLIKNWDSVAELAEKATEANKEYLQVVAEAKSSALSSAKLYDTTKLTEYERKQKEVNASLGDWGNILRKLVRTGEITQEEMDKALAYQSQKANEELKKLQKEAEKKKRDAAKREFDILSEAVNAEIALIKNRNARELAEENARYEKAVHQLKTRLATEENLTVKERAALNRLIELEEAKHQHKLADLDWQAKEEGIKKEADLLQKRLAVVEEGSEAEYNLKVQQLQAQRDLELMNTELTEEQKQLIREGYAKKEEDLRRQHVRSTHEKEMEEMHLFWENQIAEAALNNENTLQLELEQRKAELEALHQFEGESNAEFYARQLAARQAVADKEAEIAAYEVEIEQTKYEAISQITGGLRSILEAFGEENKAAAKAAKVLALAEIAINTGKAIAAGVAQAQSVAFPANIAAIATTVTTVLTNIASAISTVKSAKFATGGLVNGPGTATSDSIPARLSNGESVINARSTAMFGPLLSTLNQAGGGIAFNPAASGQREGYEFLAAAVSAGMKSVRLHVGVDEVTRVQDRVARINEVSTIG